MNTQKVLGWKQILRIPSLRVQTEAGKLRRNQWEEGKDKLRMKSMPCWEAGKDSCQPGLDLHARPVYFQGHRIDHWGHREEIQVISLTMRRDSHEVSNRSLQVFTLPAVALPLV